MTVKVSIIGAGRVGATTAYSLIHKHIVDEIILLDVVKEIAEAHALDLSHSASWSGGNIITGDYSDIKDSDIIIITAGVRRTPEMSRTDLIKANSKIVEEIIKNITNHVKDPIVIVVTNPVDVMTYLAWKISGFSRKKIFGQGSLLDSMRFRFAISKILNIEQKNIEAYVLGEHGETKVPIFSRVKIDNKPYIFTEREKRMIKNEIESTNLAVLRKKGATEYAPAVALTKMVEAVLRNKKEVVPSSTVLQGEYGLEDVCLGVPTILGRDGIIKIVEWKLPDEEFSALRHSAEKIKKFQKICKKFINCKVK